MVDKHHVNIFFTTPTAIRALMREGEAPVKRTSRKSLRLLGTVGEPINPETWEWYYHNIGDGRCPIVDTWGQTETGGILIAPLPGATVLKPGSATRPFFGVCPALVDAEGQCLEGATDGELVITRPWPGIMRTVYGDHQRFVLFYFYSKYYKNGLYFCTGEGAHRDEDGYWWITERVDGVINISGHHIGPREVESALVLHPAIADAAVVEFPHDLKGQGIYAYLTPKVGVEETESLRKELVAHVRKQIGTTATLDVIQWAPDLLKTRSGKLLRRILHKISAKELDQLGDISTLDDPDVLSEIIHRRETALIESYYYRALEIKQKSLGDEHPDVAVILNNIAELYHSQGRYSEAEKKYKRVLKILEKIHGPQHLQLITVLENYANMLKKIENRTNDVVFIEKKINLIRSNKSDK